MRIMGNMRAFISNNKYYILLFLLVVFHVFGNVLWITLNNVPPTWDAALHTVLSIKFLDYLQNNFATFNLLTFLRISDYYPPVTHLFGSVLALLGNWDPKIISLTGTIAFSGSIIFLFLYAKELFKSFRIAFFSSFFFSFFITNYQQSRMHMLDIPLTMFILMGLFFLAKSDNLKKIGYSVFFFVSFSLAFLTKWYALAYFFIPLVMVLWSWKEKSLDLSIILKRLLVGLTIFLIVCAPWYLANFSQILKRASITITPEFSSPQNLFSLENFVFNLKQIIMFQTSFLGFVFSVFSILLLLKSQLKKSSTLVVLASLLFGYLFFTFVPNKNIRYTIPLTLFIAIIMGLGLEKFFNKKWVLTLLVVPIVTYFILSFGFPLIPKYKYSLNFPILGWTDVYYLHTYPVRVIYQNTSFPYEKLLSDIYQTKSGKINVLLLKDTEEINSGILDPYLYPSISRKNDITYIGYDVVPDPKNDTQLLSYLLKNVDVVLVSTKYFGSKDYIREFDVMTKYQKYFLENKVRDYSLIGQYGVAKSDSVPEDVLNLYVKD